jgi:cysteine desulfurase/selenocysteine lyase
MIYLDNAATSFPKPDSVVEAVGEYMRGVGASPGPKPPKREESAE